MTLKLILAAGLTAAAATAQAGTFPSGGVATGVSSNVTHEVAEGHVVVDVNTDYAGFEMENEGNPMAGMAGSCIGSMQVAAGAVEGGGKCVFTDADGLTAVIDWYATGLGEDGAILGQWVPAGGAGKWNDATGGGSFVTVTDATTGVTTNRIDGEITLP